MTGACYYEWAETKHRLSVIDQHIVVEGPIRLPGPLPLTSLQVMRENDFTSLILILRLGWPWSLVMVSLFFSSKRWKAAGGNGPSASPCCRHSNHWGNYLQSKGPKNLLTLKCLEHWEISLPFSQFLWLGLFSLTLTQ